MKIIISHPTSNEFNRASVDALLKANMLGKFYTTVASFPGTLLDRLGAIKPLSDIRRRRFRPELKAHTNTWPWFEVGRQLALKAGFTKLVRRETGRFSVDAVYKSLDSRVASGLKHASQKGVSAVYAYQDGAFFSFQEAKRIGLQCLFDQPIGYWRTARRLLEVERERWPEWATTITLLLDSDTKLGRQDEELRLADRIFVASQFTANTLKDFPGTLAPIEVIPFGFPTVLEKRDYVPVSSGRPLKLLFVGGLSQRKGIADLFAVAEKMKPFVSLTVVGHKTTVKCPALDAALAKHRWIPSLPHADILAIMREHDMLVFPSLFEGFGLVITEAMSQGTPVITTDRTAGPDLIVHNENGWLIQAGSTDRLQAAIEDILLNPEKIPSIGRAAMETARSRPWEVYGRELAEAILNHKTVMK